MSITTVARWRTGPQPQQLVTRPKLSNGRAASNNNIRFSSSGTGHDHFRPRNAPWITRGYLNWTAADAVAARVIPGVTDDDLSRLVAIASMSLKCYGCTLLLYLFAFSPRLTGEFSLTHSGSLLLLLIILLSSSRGIVWLNRVLGKYKEVHLESEM